MAAAKQAGDHWRPKRDHGDPARLRCPSARRAGPSVQAVTRLPALRAMRTTTSLALAAFLAAAAATAPAQTAAVAEPPDYRTDDYRAPVPATVAGGRAIATDAAERLWREKRAVFVDVLPAPRRPEGLRPGALWKPLPRRDIPGSLWLPDVGRGTLPEPPDASFRAAPSRPTPGDTSSAGAPSCLHRC